MSMDDLALLRQYEPVVRYTAGELFFPCAIETYLSYCSLWQRTHNGETTVLFAQGSLIPEILTAFTNIPPAHRVYLGFAAETMESLEYQQSRREKPSFS